jgi:hypothetical protein
MKTIQQTEMTFGGLTRLEEQRLARMLDNNHIAHILDEHCIKRRVVKGVLQAQDQYTIDGELYARWVSVSGWTLRKLLRWLGY